MDNDAFERRLRHALNERPTLHDDTRELARLAAMDAVGRHRTVRRTVRWRPVALGAAALAVAAGSAVGAVTYLSDGGSIGDTPAARERIADTPALAFGPWFHQPEGSPRLADVPARPSLVFPPGTTYEEAVGELLESVKSAGGIPAGTALADPLPSGKVIMTPADPDDGIRLDLRAPFGYAVPSGRILPPSFVHPASTPRADVANSLSEWADNGRVGIPDGATVDAPKLRDCMILDEAAPTPACTLD